MVFSQFIAGLHNYIINRQKHATQDRQLVQMRLVLLGLLKYLFADFVEHSDFLKENTQTFRLQVQHDATTIHYLVYCYCDSRIELMVGKYQASEGRKCFYLFNFRTLCLLSVANLRD